MAAKRAKDRGWRDDPLGPIHSGRLQAAIELEGWTLSALARELTRRLQSGKPQSRQTLHHLQLGDEVKKCRQSRRAMLARVLQVPEGWLAGDQFAVEGLGYIPMVPEAVDSDRVMLAVGRLLERVVGALRRDLSGADPVVVEERLHSVAWMVAHILSPRMWRVRILARAAAALGLCHALEYALGPWLEGEAPLHQARFRDLAQLLTPAFEEAPEVSPARRRRGARRKKR
jgi:hypothetical protein